MQRRSVPRTDPRYDQLRARNNDSVKKSREKSRRERDETTDAINELEQENHQLIERIRIMKEEYQQLQDLFKQHTGISMDQLETTTSTAAPPPPPPPEKISQPVLTITTNEETRTTASPGAQLDPSALDGAIVVIDGVQYKIMNLFVYIFFPFLLVITSQQTLATNQGKRRKQDFYCSTCKLMSETIHREMNNVDPNERVQVGSYRVDGHGHQQLKEVPLIETRDHVENVVENLCSTFINHHRELIPSQLKNIYEHACDDILEAHHENLIDLLLTQNLNPQAPQQLAEYFCVETNQYCQASELDELFKPIPTTPPPSVQPEEEEEQQQEEETEEEKEKNEL